MPPVPSAVRPASGMVAERTLRADLSGASETDFKTAWSHIAAGRFDLALALLAQLEAASQTRAPALQKTGELFTLCSRHVDAARCFDRALVLAPNDPACQFNVATSLISAGKIAEAHVALERLIAQHPTDHIAYYTRAGLKRWTSVDNHVDEMLALLEPGIRDPNGEMYLCYALAKELEDLGEYERSFQFLKRGADNRRRRLSYRVEDDERSIAEIMSAFSAEAIVRARPSFASALPIFVLGLPRSGTTLVESILAAHPSVESLGEIADLGATIARAGAALPNKSALIERSVSFDMEALGRSYCDSLTSRGVAAARLIDKTPHNYLYVALIAAALPDARIVYVRRRPMEVCYAMYKTPFRMGYPFSYDLHDLGRYYVAFDRLMAHWRTVLPGRMIEIDYETLVADQEAQTRQLVAACGLPWDDACLSFHESGRAVATASAAQVRQPIYQTSVGQWRHYGRQLAPLADVLRKAGIDLEGA